MHCMLMGVNHGGTCPPEFGVGGTIIQIVPHRFCDLSTKMSILWHSKYAKIRFRLELHPGPYWTSSVCSPRPPSRLKRRYPSPYATPSGPIHLRPSPWAPQKSSHIYAYVHAYIPVYCLCIVLFDDKYI